MDRRFFHRIMSIEAPNLVVPEKLEHLMVWLLAEKLLRTNPNAGDLELASILSSEDMRPLSARILEQTASDPRWLLGGVNGFETFALAGYSFALKGGFSARGTPAYNDLRRRMGLPPFDGPLELPLPDGGSADAT